MIAKEEFHRKVYIYLLLLVAVSLPLSIFASSVFQILLGINWVAEGKFRMKLTRLKNDRAFLVFSVFYMVHIIGMIWTSDFHYGIFDLKIKLPILFLPFIIASSWDITLKEMRDILAAFIISNLIASFASIFALMNILPVEINDFRDASLFVSHIRFSLMVVLSIFFAGYLLVKDRDLSSNYMQIIYIIALIWLPVFLVILKSLSGIVIIIILILVLSFRLVHMVKDNVIRFMLNVLIIFIPLFAIIYISSSINKFYSFDPVIPGEIDSLTVQGNEYINLPENKETENGHYVWIHVCPVELEKEWEKISDYSYQGKTDNGESLDLTLIRYLTSKGLRKDATGVLQLTETDIRAIEQGTANYIYLRRFALYPRIYQVIWEFDRYKLGHSANDKSLIQRWFYLKAGASIAGEHLLTGVGTGDLRQAFNNYYEATDSPLKTERRRRAHNQFLSLAIAFGIPGLAICLAAFIVPVFINNKWSSYLAIIFLLTIGLSMLDEDTLENTPGAVMFGLFYGLFILDRVQKR